MARKSYRYKTNEDGFTLVLMAALLIVAAMIGATVFQKSKRDDFWNPKVETQRKLDRIAMVLIAYQREYKRLPCPARFDVTPASADHGAEETGCAGTVAIGALPYKALGLASDYSVDSWGNKMLYAVSPILTTGGSDYLDNTGNITVDDNGLVNTKAAYVVLSHGVNRIGAYIDTATAIRNGYGCGVTTPAPGIDRENCDGDDEFVVDSLNEVVGSEYYDDHVIWRLVDSAAQNM